jgi:hypothetical protein
MLNQAGGLDKQGRRAAGLRDRRVELGQELQGFDEHTDSVRGRGEVGQQGVQHAVVEEEVARVLEQAMVRTSKRSKTTRLNYAVF